MRRSTNRVVSAIIQPKYKRTHANVEHKATDRYLRCAFLLSDCRRFIFGSYLSSKSVLSLRICSFFIFDLFYFPDIFFISFWFLAIDYSPEPSYVLMHSDVWNCDIKAFLPTPGAPNINTRYESTGAREWCESAGEWCGDIGLLGARLLLLERRRRNESPRLMTPAKKRKIKYKWNEYKEIKSDQNSWEKKQIADKKKWEGERGRRMGNRKGLSLTEEAQYGRKKAHEEEKSILKLFRLMDQSKCYAMVGLGWMVGLIHIFCFFLFLRSLRGFRMAGIWLTLTHLLDKWGFFVEINRKIKKKRRQV